MENGRERRTALAVMAAVAGTGYASGRELTLFFAQLGWMSWVGIALASGAFGLATGLLARWGAGRLPGARPGSLSRAERVAALLRALLLALIAAVMLLGAAETGALTLPSRYGRLWGAGIALALASLMNLGRLRAMPWLGLSALGLGMAFHLGLFLDPRPAQTWLIGDADLALEGSLPAAMLLALTYSALNACVAADTVVRFSRGCARPVRLGAWCGGLLGLALLCANAALLRGGRTLLGQALPMVLLSARWVLWGFWLCAAFDYLCRLCTLAAALGGLIRLFVAKSWNCP